MGVEIVFCLVILIAIGLAILHFTIRKNGLRQQCETLEVKLKIAQDWGAASKRLLDKAHVELDDLSRKYVAVQDEASKAWQQYNTAMTKVECLEKRGAQAEAELERRRKLDTEFDKQRLASEDHAPLGIVWHEGPD